MPNTFRTLILQASACKTNTTQNQLHQISNTQRTENKSTDVVIQQHSRKLLKMDILTSETCWAHKKWKKKQVTSNWSFIPQQTYIFCFKSTLESSVYETLETGSSKKRHSFLRQWASYSVRFCEILKARCISLQKMLPAPWLYLNRQINERREERIADFPVLDISHCPEGTSLSCKDDGL